MGRIIRSILILFIFIGGIILNLTDARESNSASIVIFYTINIPPESRFTSERLENIIPADLTEVLNIDSSDFTENGQNSENLYINEFLKETKIVKHIIDNFFDASLISKKVRDNGIYELDDKLEKLKTTGKGVNAGKLSGSLELLKEDDDSEEQQLIIYELDKVKDQHYEAVFTFLSVN